jgi:hypothetical protein
MLENPHPPGVERPRESQDSLKLLVRGAGKSRLL